MNGWCVSTWYTVSGYSREVFELVAFVFFSESFQTMLTVYPLFISQGNQIPIDQFRICDHV